jgi:periplasmic protein TonB
MKKAQSLVVCVASLIGIAVLLGGSPLCAQQQPDAYGIYKVGNGVSPPKAIYAPQPEYSEKARKEKLSGSVRLSVTVSADGVVRDAKVSKGLEKSLDQQAVKAVSTWKFEPAVANGKPVPVYVEVEVTFNIQ